MIVRAPVLLLALLGLLASSACESRRLPPGNWQGRCQPSPDASGSVRYGPPLERYADDKASMFRPGFVAELQTALSAFQKETCHQLQFITVRGIGDTVPLEKYALDYANRTGLGYRGLNNGVLLMLEYETRKARIQIGCGLEDVISDAQANEVLQRDLLPAFRGGQLQDGVQAAFTSLMELARKKAIANEFRPDGCKQ